jgi:hypothetical protein
MASSQHLLRELTAQTAQVGGWNDQAWIAAYSRAVTTPIRSTLRERNDRSSQQRFR